MLGVVVASLTITNPYVFKILNNFLLWVGATWRGLNTSESPSGEHGVTTSLLRSPSGNGQKSSPGEDEHLNSRDAESGPSAAVSSEQNVRLPGLQNGGTVNPAPGHIRQSQYGTETISDNLDDSRDSREAASRLIRSSLDRLKKQRRSPDILVVVLLTMFFGLFVGYIVASTFSAKIASDRAGLASSQYCGIWQFDDKAGDEAAERDDLYNYQKEARASQYARTCYNAPNPDDPFSCRIFYNQSIEFDTKTDQPCPFASSELCSGGLYSAVSFDTGLVDASVIGVNAPVTHKFRRTTSCSPLNMSKPYIVSSEGTDNTDYHYYYGRKDDIEYTFNTSGRPFDWLVPVYSVK